MAQCVRIFQVGESEPGSRGKSKNPSMGKGALLNDLQFCVCDLYLNS